MAVQTLVEQNDKSYCQQLQLHNLKEQLSSSTPHPDGTLSGWAIASSSDFQASAARPDMPQHLLDILRSKNLIADAEHVQTSADWHTLAYTSKMSILFAAARSSFVPGAVGSVWHDEMWHETGADLPFPIDGNVTIGWQDQPSAALESAQHLGVGGTTPSIPAGISGRSRADSRRIPRYSKPNPD